MKPSHKAHMQMDEAKTATIARAVINHSSIRIRAPDYTHTTGEI